MSWIIAEGYPKEELEKEGVSAKWMQGKWEEVAEDMALIPERNVRIRETEEMVFIEVSEEMMRCMKGI